jgi:ribosome-associated protein
MGVAGPGSGCGDLDQGHAEHKPRDRRDSPGDRLGYTADVEPLHIRSGLSLPAAALAWRAVRASGAGGQNVNKVATKIDLRLDLAACDVLDEPTKARLRDLAGERGLDARGRIIVTSQRTRERERNLEDARDKLRTLVLRALVRPRRRRATRPTAGSRAARRTAKARRGQVKRARGRVTLDD